jgi:hypothetical protein
MLFSNGAKTAPGGRRRNGVRPLSSLVEHFLGKEEVVGPIPTGGSALQSDVAHAASMRKARGGVAQVVRAHGS